MKLNYLEFIAMNNPVRRYIQDKYELKILREISTVKEIDTALEIGCGSGHGSMLIKKYFFAKNITGIDLDERMIRKAEKRKKITGVTFRVMDASKLDFPECSFDAVFDFGIIHHIPNWKDCIDEIHRVLKPDGELILEDLSRESFIKDIGLLYRIISVHPYNELYTVDEFIEYLKKVGFEIISFRKSNPLGLIRFFSLYAKKGNKI
jgi:ubiquinone/menaquinone biosynthesis C-methylase UbiE